MTRPRRFPVQSSARLRIGTLALLAALLVLPLALAPRAEAFIYWPTDVKGYQGIARANLDGTNQYSLIKGIHSAQGSIAVDARYIYWAGHGQANAPEPDVAIARARLDGTKIDWTFIPHAVGASEGIGQIAVGNDHIYWVRAGSAGPVIDRANLEGTVVERGFITGFAEGAVVTGVAVDTNHIYWSQTGGTGSSSTAAIGRANLDGTGVEKGFIPFPNGTEAFGVEVDAAHVYWSRIRRDPSSPEETIGRANLDGTGVNQSFIGGFPYGHFVEDLAVDAGYIYLMKLQPEVIGRANIDGSAVDQSIIPNAQLFGAQSIAVNISLGELKRDKKNGTAKLTVELPAPGGVALAPTKKLKGAEVRAEAAGEVQLAIKPRGKAKKKLAAKGKVKVGVEVAYTPDGGEPEAQTATLRLKR